MEIPDAVIEKLMAKVDSSLYGLDSTSLVKYGLMEYGKETFEFHVTPIGQLIKDDINKKTEQSFRATERRYYLVQFNQAKMKKILTALLGLAGLFMCLLMNRFYGFTTAFCALIALSLLIFLIEQKKDIPQNEADDERILCSAIWYKDIQLKHTHHKWALPINCDRGIVICGYGCARIMSTMYSLTGLNKESEIGISEQGFLTSKNRFLNRTNAAKLHVKNGGTLNYSSDTLFSDDLY